LLLEIALILILTGLVTLVLVSRSGSARPGGEVEAAIDRLTGRLQAGPSLLGSLLAALVQSLGCRLLGALSAQQTVLGFLQAQQELAEGMLREPDRAWLKAWFERMATLREALWEQPEAAVPVDLLEPIPALGPRVVLEARATLEKSVEDEVWGALELMALKLEALKLAFSEPTLIDERAREFMERWVLLLQGLGALQSLALGLRRSWPRAELEALAAAVGQSLFCLHTLGRLGFRESADEISQGLAGLGREFLILQRSLESSLLGHLLDAEQAIQGEDWSCLALAGQKLAERAQELAAARLSGEWRVTEMLYAHPRGLKVAAELQLKCRGCLLAERETLAMAARVHDVGLDRLLGALGTQP